MPIKKTILLLSLLTLISEVFHFYNLTWGAPFYFHPDERNIASSVSQLQFPEHLNPHFFAYGSLPIYSIYFTGIAINFFNQFLTLNFEQAIFISRFYSALFATLLIPILFLIGKQLKNETTGLLAAFLATTSVGFIQFAHFGTFEMWLTFFSVLLFWVCLQKTTLKTMLLAALIFGVLVAIKVSSLALFPLLLLFVIKKYFFVQQNFMVKIFRLFFLLTDTLLVILLAGIVYFATNPFVLLDTAAFKGTMEYESSLAMGTLPVFYTGEFYNTLPVIFQFLHVYPFLLNPLITLMFVPSFLYLIWKMLKTKNQAYLILTTFYLILFLSQAFLFAKWTRYMLPTLPFIFLIVGIALTDFLNKKRQPFNHLAILTIFIAINFLFAVSYFITAFVKPDTRIEAYHFAQKNIPSNAPILSEIYDLGIVPFNQSFSNISLFNFYDLDNNSPDWTKEKLITQLSSIDYLIVPSPRILKTRSLNTKQFPQASIFYQYITRKTLNASLTIPDYTKIYETPCDIFCKITYLGSPVFRFEQTANVFDRPTVMIFKKTQ